MLFSYYARKIIGFIVFAVCINFAVFETNAQKKTYIGDPVNQQGLVKVLKAKQYQTRQIIQVIVAHGVDFRLSSAVRKELAEAGARPDLLTAIEQNYRGKAIGGGGKSGGGNSNYENLIETAAEQFNAEKNPSEALKTLEKAVEMNPRNFQAYQLLGIVHLYGFENFKAAETNMKKAIDLSGSAVFRVKHGHDLTFSYSCEGSLYISKNDVRYESDNVEHTFDVPIKDITNAKMLGGWGKFIRRKGGAFKIVIRDRDDDDENDKDKYNFSPLTGEKEEAKMIIDLIGK